MIRAFRSQPITIKAPLLVVGLMVMISVIISERVLTRLSQTQSRHIEELVDSYLDGVSSSVLPHVLNQDIWEVFDALERSRTLYDAVNPFETLVVDQSGKVLAASNPDSVATLSDVPPEYTDQNYSGPIRLDIERERALAKRSLQYQGLNVGTIYAVFDISHLVAERRSVLVALITTNIFLTALLAAVGYCAVSHMVRPVRILSEHLRQGQTDPPVPIAQEDLLRESGEMAQLFERYNALVKSQNDREVLAMKLAEEERIASLGRLASGMAHEINNPLGGLFNAIDTLKRHGDVESVRSTSISLLERGLTGIRDVVAAALSIYRSDRTARSLRAADLEDLKLLIQPEIRRRHLHLEWNNGLPESLSVQATPVRQAALNLLLNACAASPENGTVGLSARLLTEGTVEIAVTDMGQGLSEPLRRLLEGDKDLSPIRSGEGLGLWMVRRLMRDVHGSIAVNCPADGGTQIILTFDVSHMEQLGDVA